MWRYSYDDDENQHKNQHKLSSSANRIAMQKNKNAETMTDMELIRSAAATAASIRNESFGSGSQELEASAREGTAQLHSEAVQIPRKRGQSVDRSENRGDQQEDTGNGKRGSRREDRRHDWRRTAGIITFLCSGEHYDCDPTTTGRKTKRCAIGSKKEFRIARIPS